MTTKKKHAEEPEEGSLNGEDAGSAPLAEDQVKIRCLRTISDGPTVGSFVWKFECGPYKEGSEHVIPKNVADHLVGLNAAVIIK